MWLKKKKKPLQATDWEMKEPGMLVLATRSVS